MTQVGQKIKKIRELKNLTQEYVAERLSMKQSGYSKIETGETDLTLSKLEEIAKILQVNPEEIMAFDEQRFFNSPNNIKGSNNGITINPISPKIEKLYEDKILLLEQLLKSKDEVIAQLRGRN